MDCYIEASLFVLCDAVGRYSQQRVGVPCGLLY